MDTFFVIILRTILAVVLLTIGIKVMGKREVGQLSIFDFLIVLSIADVMIIAIENYEDSVWNSIIPLIVIVLLQKLVAILDLKIPFFRKVIDGKEVVVIKNGKLDIEAMKKENYNMSDLYAQLREKNIRDIGEVQYAILEVNGNLSVFTYKEDFEHSYPIPIIVSGKIDKKALLAINKDIKWVYKELKKHNVKNIKEVFGATYKKDHLEIVKVNKTE